MLTSQSNYYLMNKDNIVATFRIKPLTKFLDEVIFELQDVFNGLPIEFKDINT